MLNDAMNGVSSFRASRPINKLFIPFHSILCSIFGKHSVKRTELADQSFIAYVRNFFSRFVSFSVEMLSISD